MKYDLCITLNTFNAVNSISNIVTQRKNLTKKFDENKMMKSLLPTTFLSYLNFK